MGANIEYDKLTQSRNKIIDEILDNIKNWNGDIETGIELVNNNGIDIDKVKKINEEIDSLNMANYPNDEYREKLNALYIEQKNLFKVLEKKQGDLMDEKQQLSKKEDVVKSYISKKGNPIFIDKDVE